jgi:hypothetical protein
MTTMNCHAYAAIGGGTFAGCFSTKDEDANANAHGANKNPGHKARGFRDEKQIA